MPLDVEKLLEEQAEAHGINPIVLKSLVFQESGFNPVATNKRSSAAGLGQFVTGTWQDEVKRLGLPYSLEDRLDPHKNAQVTAAHVRHNMEELGLDPSDPSALGPAYLAHFRGMGGAREMLNADPDANPYESLNNWGTIVNANPFLKDARTVGEAIEKIYGVVGRHTSRFGGEQEPPYQMVQGQEPEEFSLDTTKTSYGTDEIAQLLEQLDAASATAESSNNVRSPVPPTEVQRQEALQRQEPPTELSADRLLRTAGAAIPRGIADIPTVGAILTAIPELGLKAGGIMEEDSSPTYQLLQAGQAGREGVNEFFGIDNPRNPVEMAVEIGAQTAIPFARGARIRGFLPNALEVATPFTIGGGKGRAAANFGAQFVGHEALRPLLADENDPYRTIFDRMVFVGEAEAGEEFPSTDNQKVEVTPGGPMLPRSELATLGMFGLATLGFAAGPHVWRRWAASRVPTPPSRRGVDRTGEKAPIQLETIETNRDLLKTYMHGPSEGLKDILARGGVDAFEDISTHIDVETHAGSRMKVNTALQTGRLDSYAGNYNSPIPPARLYEAYRGLPKDKQKLTSDYILMNDILDDMAISGRNRVGGYTKQQVNTNLSNIVRTFPEVRAIHDRYKQVMNAGLDFAAEGPFGLFSPKKAAELKASRPNYVHWEIESIPPDLPLSERMARRAQEMAAEHKRLEDVPSFTKKREIASGNVRRTDPFEAMMVYTEQVLQAKMKNNIQGRIVDAWMDANKGKQGTKSIVRVDKDVLDKHPEWTSRMFSIFRNGERKYYVASQHIADTIRFDPLSARHQWAYLPARGFQIGTTGAGNPLFSTLAFVRETQLGQINAPRQGALDFVPGGRMPQAAWAVPKQVFPEMMKGLSNRIYRTLDSGEGGKVIRALTGNNEGIMRGLASRMSHAYLNSSKYAIDAQGGVNAALSQNAVQPAKGMFDEMVRNVDLPYSTRQYAAGWRTMLDAVHNGSRFVYATRNGAHDLSIPKAERAKILREAKELTGDITKAGQVYNKYGKIGVDAVKNRGTQAFNMSVVGPTQNFLLEASPFYNAMLKGLSRWGKAYVDKPTSFMAKTTSTLLMPTFAAYGSAFSMGDEYIKYMMDLRSERDKAMNLYIPIPGRPPEEGIEIPLPHEAAIINYMFLTMLDHTLRGQEGDGQAAAKQGIATLTDAVLDLTTPPVFQGMAASQGVKIDSGLLFGRGPYIPQENPHSNYQHNLELMIRALGGAAAATFIDTTNAGFDGGLEAAWEELKYQQAKRVPIAKDKQLSNFTHHNDVLWKKREQLDKILDVYGDHIDPDGMGKIRKRALSTPRSAEGRNAVEGINLPPNEMVGINTPKPNNPVFLFFADEMKKRLGTNQFGFRSLIDRYGFFNAHLRQLRNINSGNVKDWWEQIKDNEEVIRYISSKGVTVVNRDAPRKIINEMYKDQFEVVERLEKQFADMEHKVQLAAKNNPRFLHMLKQHGIDPRSLEKFTMESLDPYL